MANEDLKRFMVERLLVLDPTLSDNAGARMYSTVIDPLVKRLGVDPLSVNIATFITARMEALFPELDITSPGSMLKDLLVRPMTLLLEPVQREIELVRQQKSVDDLAVLTSEELDAIVANIFVERNVGAFARGVVRLYFASPTAVGLDNSILFYTADGENFVPDEVRVYQPSDMRRSGSRYFIDVNVRSQEPRTSANVAANEIRFARNIDSVLRVTNPQPIRFGVSEETNQELFDRAGRILTERSMNTGRGIQAQLRNIFPDVLSVSVTGYGEPEMGRDILKADITLDTEELVGSLVYQTSSWKTEPALLGGGLPIVPFTNILRIETPTAAQRLAIEGATFLRVSDGTGSFHPALVSRVREVESVTDDVGVTGDVIVRLKDFTVYPHNGDETSPSAGGTADTTGDIYGFNQFSPQGSNFALTTTDNVTSPGVPVERMIGAPLPFTNTLTSGVPVGNMPSSVVPGRDFLVYGMMGPYWSDSGAVPQALQDSPSVLRVHPLLGVNADILSIGRADSHLVDKGRIAYPGAANFIYAPTSGTIARNNTPTIIDFGAPKWTAVDLTRLDGVSVSEWGRNPGVRMHSLNAGGGAYVAGYADMKTTVVTLEATQPGWAARGVSVSHFISLALYEGDGGGGAATGLLSEASQTTGKLRWHAWGRIVEVLDDHNIRVDGVDASNLTDNADYPQSWDREGFTDASGAFPLNVYPLAWTVYEGVRTHVRPSGELVQSYDDFQYLPQYKMDSAVGTGLVHAPFVAYYTGDKFVPQSAHSHAATVAAWKDNTAWWIRLNKDLLAVAPSLGTYPTKLLDGGEVIMIDDGVALSSPDQEYLQAKYLEHTTIEVDSGADRSGLVQSVASIGTEGSHYFDADDPAPAGSWRPAAYYLNHKGVLGYLLPHPMGSLYSNAKISSAAWGSELSPQVVQFYAARNDEVDSSAVLTVSDIPGSVAFPEAFGKTLVVKDNEIHLGGLTDVYVKMASEIETVSDLLSLVPSDLLDSSTVLASGIDGTINFTLNPGHFVSPTLAAFLDAHLSLGGGVGSLGNLVVEIVEPVADILPAAVQAVTMVAGGVLIDGIFIGAAGTHNNIRWRLHNEVVTSLYDPVVVLQQGTDLITTAGGLFVTIPGGVNYVEALGGRQHLLVVDNGPNKGEYIISAKGVTTVSMLTATLAGGDSGSYKIVAKQAGQVDLPFVRIKQVSMSGDTAEGVIIPYRHPVDIEASSFQGLNDDPWNDDTTPGVEGTLACDGINPATFKAVAPDPVLPLGSWGAYGVITHDVLRIDGVGADVTYWSVAGVDKDENGVDLDGSLLLDRVTTAFSSEKLGFTLGHAAVGTATVRFKDRTLYEAGPDTVFQFTQTDGVTYRFRPSPAESSIVYASAYTATGVTSSVGTQMDFDSTTSLFKHNPAIGDRIVILSRVLASSLWLMPFEVAVSGKTLVFAVDDARYSVTFTGTGLQTLTSIAADINRQASDVVRAVVSADTLQFHSRGHLQILDEGTAGILTLLRYGAGVVRDNKDMIGLYGSFPITGFGYDAAANVSAVTFLGPGPTSALGVFVDIVRYGTQRVYPGDFVEEDNGLFSTEIKVLSYDPLERTTVLPGQAFTSTGYLSFGYEVVTDNANYTFSMGERSSIRCTPIVLGEMDTDLLTSYVVPAASVIVTYDRAPQVDAIQSFMLLKSERVQNHNPLVRHYLPAYPLIEIDYSGSIDPDVVKTAVGNYLATLYPNKPLEVFSLLAAVRALNVPYVSLPQKAGFMTIREDRTIVVERSMDVVYLDDRFHIMGDLSGITINKR